MYVVVLALEFESIYHNFFSFRFKLNSGGIGAVLPLNNEPFKLVGVGVKQG